MARRLLPIALVVAVLLVVVAHVIWLVESRKNPDHFPRRYLAGMGEALWWASVTMTTVGYGDRTPRGRWGRMLAVLWMFVAILVIANITAGLSAASTVSQIPREDRRRELARRQACGRGVRYDLKRLPQRQRIQPGGGGNH